MDASGGFRSYPGHSWPGADREEVTNPRMQSRPLTATKMITIEQATKELSDALADVFPERAFGEWRRDIVILVDTPLHVDPKRPNQRAREILLRFGERAMHQYRAAQQDSRKNRRAKLRAFVLKRMPEYDPAPGAKKGEYLPQFVIECADAISD
jgi:hypothetical protein